MTNAHSNAHPGTSKNVTRSRREALLNKRIPEELDTTNKAWKGRDAARSRALGFSLHHYDHHRELSFSFWPIADYCIKLQISSSSPSNRSRHLCKSGPSNGYASGCPSQGVKERGGRGGDGAGAAGAWPLPAPRTRVRPPRSRPPGRSRRALPGRGGGRAPGLTAQRRGHTSALRDRRRVRDRPGHHRRPLG